MWGLYVVRGCRSSPTCESQPLHFLNPAFEFIDQSMGGAVFFELLDQRFIVPDCPVVPALELLPWRDTSVPECNNELGLDAPLCCNGDTFSAVGWPCISTHSGASPRKEQPSAIQIGKVVYACKSRIAR